jgi:hypothetical protein
MLHQKSAPETNSKSHSRALSVFVGCTAKRSKDK